MSDETAAPGRGLWFLVSDLFKTLFGLAAFGQWIVAGVWFVLMGGTDVPTLLAVSACFCYLVARDIKASS